MTSPRKRRLRGKPPSAGTTSTQSSGLPQFERSEQRQRIERPHRQSLRVLCVTTKTSAAPRCLDRGNVDLLHAHHRIEGALGYIAAGRERLGQHARRDLPGDAPLVFAPAARALLAATADDGVPIAVGLCLIVGGDLEREGFVVLEHGTAVEAETGYAGDRECDRQHVALLAGRVVTGCTVDGTHRTVGKGLGVEAGSSLGVLVVP